MGGKVGASQGRLLRDTPSHSEITYATAGTAGDRLAPEASHDVTPAARPVRVTSSQQPPGKAPPRGLRSRGTAPALSHGCPFVEDASVHKHFRVPLIGGEHGTVPGPCAPGRMRHAQPGDQPSQACLDRGFPAGAAVTSLFTMARVRV